ncbi:MAG: DoxX family protein [Planctomycetes bacterium]|nr:DoxX family protein [Planctomycetota bacterium]
MDAKKQDLTNSIGLLILRAGIGSYMVTHGWQKLQMLLNNQAEMMGTIIGIPPPFSLILPMLAEFVCAILVIIGLGTRFAAAPIAFTMLVAAFVGHANDPLTMGEAFELFMTGKTKMPMSKQPALMFLFPFLALIFTGAGKLSLDGLVNWPKVFARMRQKKAAK